MPWRNHVYAASRRHTANNAAHHTGMSTNQEKVEHARASMLQVGRQPSVLSDDRSRFRERIAKRNDHARPHAGVMTAIVGFGDVGGDISLQGHRTKVVADQTPKSELALLGVARDRLVQIPGAKSNRADLPIAELFGCGQIEIDEVGI